MQKKEAEARRNLQHAYSPPRTCQYVPGRKARLSLRLIPSHVLHGEQFGKEGLRRAIYSNQRYTTLKCLGLGVPRRPGPVKNVLKPLNKGF